MVEINTEDKKGAVYEQRQDIATYYNMVDCLRKKLDEAGLRISWVDKREKRMHLSWLARMKKRRESKKNLEISVKLTPSSLSEDCELNILFIEVHKKEALGIVKGVVEDYSKKYNHLEKINIDTYF